MPLTDRAIRNAKPAAKDTFVADGGGLYLRIYPTGNKTFVYRSRDGGRARWIKVGDYPAMSLADAREVAHGMSHRLPEHREMNCRACYDTWLKGISKDYARPDHVTFQMERYFLPKFDTRLLSTVSTAEVSALLAEVAAHAPVSANRLLGMVKLMFAFAVQRGWITVSPVAAITRKVVGGKEASRERALSDDELVSLIHILRTDRFAEKTRIVIALLMLTGQRTSEVMGVTRAEVRARQWSLPAHRTKNRTAHGVHLPQPCKGLFEYAFKTYGTAPFDGMDSHTAARAISRMKFDPPFTPHDLRRTMATRMADLGVPPHVIEKCLNHKMQGVMGIYNRADYAAEKAAAWRLWARHLLRLAKRKPPARAGG